MAGATLQFTWKGQIRLWELLDFDATDFRDHSDLDQFLLLWNRSGEGSDLQDDPRILEHFGGQKGLERIIKKAQTAGYLEISLSRGTEELRDIHIRDQTEAEEFGAFEGWEKKQARHKELKELSKARRIARREERGKEWADLGLTKEEYLQYRHARRKGTWTGTLEEYRDHIRESK